MTSLLTPPEGVFTRRSFLRVAGAGALAVTAAGALAGCNEPSPSGPGATTVGGDLFLFTWGGYEGKDVMKDWYTTNGINMQFKSVTNENIGSVIKGPGGDHWDASSVNQGDAQYYYDGLKVSSPVTVAEVPNLAKLLPFFKDGSFWKISDGVYHCVPWTWGPIGISYRQDRVKPSDIPSWQTLTEPAWTGRVGTFDDPLNMIALGAVATGIDPATVTKEQLNGPIKDYLTKLRKNIKVLSGSIGDQVNTLVSGDVDLQLVGITTNNGAAAQQGVKVGFMTPEKEGSFGFCDSVFIPPTAKHRANALAYANALLGGDTAVAMNNSLAQLSPNDEVNAKLDTAVRSLFPEDLAVYSGKTLKWNRSYFDPNGKFATVDEWKTVWQTVKA